MADWLSAEGLTAFTWLRPLWLVLPLGLLLLSRRTARGWLAAQLPNHLATALRLGSATGHAARLERALRWLLVVLLSVALAGPAWRLDPLDASLGDTQLTVVVDLSDSALLTDLAPSRLERGRYLLEALWRRADGVASELWAVAGSAHRALPVSRDSAVSGLYLRELAPSLMPQQGRSLTALNSLWMTPPKTIVVLTGVLSGSDRQLLASWQAAGSAVHLVWLNSQPLADPPADISVYAASDGSRSVDQLHRNLMAEQWRRQPGERRYHRDLSPWLAGLVAWLVLLRGALQLLSGRVTWLVVLACSALLTAAPDRAEATDLIGATQSSAPANASSWRDRALAQMLTPDQRGRWYFERDQYRRAASHFIDPAWAGVSYYRARDYTAARAQFAQLNSAEGWYNAALAAAAQRRYDYALNDANRALAARPQWPPAVALRTQLVALLAAMASQAEQQQTEQWQSESEPLALDERELPARSSGELAEIDSGNQLSAEQLADAALRAAWLKQVSRGPGEFLARKFGRQWRASATEQRDE